MGSQVARSFTLTNTSKTLGAEISSIAVTTAPIFTLDDSATTCAAGEMPPGAECILGVTFSPSAKGKVTGKATVSFSDGCSAVHRKVTGKGIAATASPTPTASATPTPTPTPSPSPTPTGAASPTVAAVTEYNSAEVDVFSFPGVASPTASPSSVPSTEVTPTVSIAGPSTGLSSPISAAFDSAGNLYVVNENGGIEYGTTGQGSITIYGPLSGSGTQDLAPIATIEGEFNLACTAAAVPYACCSGPGTGTCVDNTGLNDPSAIAIDPATGNIYVANFLGGSALQGSVSIFPPLGNQTGLLNIAPIATIVGADTGLDTPAGVAVQDNGSIWVANYQSINEYPPLGSSTGALDEAPLASISGSATDILGLAGLLLYPPTASTSVFAFDSFNGVLQFPTAISGDENIAPTTVTSGNGIASPANGAVAAGGSDVLVTNINGGVVELDPQGNVVQTFTSSSFDQPSGIAVQP